MSWSFEDQMTEVVEGGRKFKTGTPLIDLPVTHRKQNTQYFGALHGQDVEPAGRYLNHGHFGEPGVIIEPGGHRVETIHYMVTFRKPLVLKWGGWKMNLYREYQGISGVHLSNRMVLDGYDAIITVSNDSTCELVDLTMFNGFS